MQFPPGKINSTSLPLHHFLPHEIYPSQSKRKKKRQRQKKDFTEKGDVQGKIVCTYPFPFPTIPSSRLCFHFQLAQRKTNSRAGQSLKQFFWPFFWRYNWHTTWYWFHMYMIEYSYTICCEKITTVSLVNIHHPLQLQFLFLPWGLLRFTLLATFKYARQFIYSPYYDVHHSPGTPTFWSWKFVPKALLK